MTATLPQEIHALIDAYPPERRFALAVLQDIQREFNYLPEGSLTAVSEYLGTPEAQLYAIATFYKALSLTPKGRHIIKVCDGTACHIRGSVSLVSALERNLGVPAGATTSDGLFTVETINCLGACALAPVMLVDGIYYPKVTPEKIHEILERYRASAFGNGGGNE